MLRMNGTLLTPSHLLGEKAWVSTHRSPVYIPVGKSDPNLSCEITFLTSRTARGIPQLLDCPWALALPIQELPEPKLGQSLVEQALGQLWPWPWRLSVGLQALPGPTSSLGPVPGPRWS